MFIYMVFCSRPIYFYINCTIADLTLGPSGSWSYCSWIYNGGQFIGGGNRITRRNPPTCRKSLTNFMTSCCIEYTSPWVIFQLTTLVVIGTGFTDSLKSTHNTITIARNHGWFYSWIFINQIVSFMTSANKRLNHIWKRLMKTRIYFFKMIFQHS
jgi:hypothetical protein